jgi:ABC-2 type transport system ATP-binding protein
MSGASDVILDVRGVSKSFDRTRAVDDVSFRVYRGDVFALLGPNGAGKTTLANMILGALTPDTGSITYRLHGRTVEQPEPIDLGYFPCDTNIYGTLPINRMLSFSAFRRGIAEDEAEEATKRWLERLGMSHRANTWLSKLSKGNQQKVFFAEAVLHRPSLVFFDEPFAGLDPLNQELFITLIREMQDQGMTVLISDHQLSLVERLADQMLIIDQGQVIAGGTLDDLRRQAETGIRVRLRLADPYAPIDLSFLGQHPAIRSYERTASGEVRILTYANIVPVEVLNYAKMNLRISEIFSEPASLHDVYVQIIRLAAEEELDEVASGGVLSLAA